VQLQALNVVISSFQDQVGTMRFINARLLKGENRGYSDADRNACLRAGLLFIVDQFFQEGDILQTAFLRTMLMS
jgi:hypothetical protein